jgi:hypothetical protein
LALLTTASIAPPATLSADEARLEQEVKGVARSLPFAGQAKSIGDGLKGGYDVDGVSGAVDYPAGDEKPPHVVFGVHWAISGFGAKPLTAAELDQKWAGDKQGWPKGATEGAFGQHSWMSVSVERGTMDPNSSGDPYMGYAQGSVRAECATVSASVGIAIYSHVSHGARNKPAVLEALKRATEAHLRTVMGQLVAILRFGCSGDIPEGPKADSIEAEPSCTTVRLVRGKLPSEECGIYVRNWPASRAVTTCFPDLIDAWGLLPHGIIATFANEYFHVGAVIAKGRASGEYYLPIWWYAQCQAVPGLHDVEVFIQESDAVPTIGGCPTSSNRAHVRIRVEVLEERSPNCDMRSNGGAMAGTSGGSTGNGTGGPAGGGSSGGGRTGPAGPFVGRWRTNFGDLTLSDAGDGNVRGTLGGSGVVVIGKVKGNEFVGTFSDANGDGVIHLVSPDGNSVEGEWKRRRGPDAGTSGRISGTYDPTGGPGSEGSGPGLPGGGPGTGGAPGGPGTSGLPPQRPIPAPLTGLTLQAPELRVTPGQEVPVSIWLLNAKDVVNMNWELTFDPSVASASTSAGSVVKGNLLTEAFEANPSEPGRARMGFAQKKGVEGTGTVSVHRLKAIGAVGTRTPLTLSVGTITDSRPRALPIVTLHGYLEIVAPGSTPPGSSGGQPGVTLQDAYNALRMSVGLIPVNLALDVDHDGKVTSLDAYLIMTTVFLTMKGGK